LAGCSGDGDDGGTSVTPADVPAGPGDATLPEIRAVPTPDPGPAPRVPAAHLEASLDRLLGLVETASNLLARSDIRYVLEDRQRIEGGRRFLERSSEEARRTLAYLRAVREEIREIAGVIWHLRAIAGWVQPDELPDPREPAAAARRYGDGLAYRGELGTVLAYVAPAERLLRGAVRAGERFEPPTASPGGVGWPEAVRSAGAARAGARRSLADARALVGAVAGDDGNGNGNGPSQRATLEGSADTLRGALADVRDRLRGVVAEADRETARGRLLGRLVPPEGTYRRGVDDARRSRTAGRQALAVAELAGLLVGHRGAAHAVETAELEPGDPVDAGLVLLAKRRAVDRLRRADEATAGRPFARSLLAGAGDLLAAGDDRLGREPDTLAAVYRNYLLAEGVAAVAGPVAAIPGG
jgi:hypothetical protein